MARVDEVADGIYRISTMDPEFSITVNQFFVDDEVCSGVGRSLVGGPLGSSMPLLLSFPTGLLILQRVAVILTRLDSRCMVLLVGGTTQALIARSIPVQLYCNPLYAAEIAGSDSIHLLWSSQLMC